MEIYIRSDTELLATYREGKLYLAPGVSRELVAFELFRAMTQAVNEASNTPGVAVTWGTAYAPIGANQGGA